VNSRTPVNIRYNNYSPILYSAYRRRALRRTNENWQRLWNGLTENFTSPIPIVPTTAQIERATSTMLYSDTTMVHDRCPIDRTLFNPNDSVIIINHCGHTFRSQNLMTWFQSNSKCPICRFDIRNNVSDNDVSMNNVSEDDVSTNNVSENDVSMNNVSMNNVSENDVSDDDGSMNNLSEDYVIENDVSGNDEYRNNVIDNDVSGNNEYRNNVIDNDVSGNNEYRDDEYTQLTNFITDIFFQEFSRYLQDNSFTPLEI
jgi:hypothetical protein